MGAVRARARVWGFGIRARVFELGRGFGLDERAQPRGAHALIEVAHEVVDGAREGLAHFKDVAQQRERGGLACGRAVREDHAHRGEERGEGLERALPEVTEERDESLVAVRVRVRVGVTVGVRVRNRVRVRVRVRLRVGFSVRVRASAMGTQSSSSHSAT